MAFQLSLISAPVYAAEALPLALQDLFDQLLAVARSFKVLAAFEPASVRFAQDAQPPAAMPVRAPCRALT